jgi:exodeoxyribonuclease V beta subunit
MSSSITYLSFDARTVPLEGSNLIEASAGTGKTYSIAILVLRLVLEQKLPLKDILMVTFTKAAVAELNERVRLFLRMAWQCSRGGDCADPLIAGIVTDAVASGTDAAGLLNDAMLLLDDLSVLTIHGFCQNMLREFAFETAHPFAAETIPSIKPMATDLFNKFWRQRINTLPPALLRQLNPVALRRQLSDAVNDQLDGRYYYGYEPDRDYKPSETLIAGWIAELEAFAQQAADKEQAAYDLYWNAVQAKIQTGKNLVSHNAGRRPHNKPRRQFRKNLKEDFDYIQKHHPEIAESLQAFLNEHATHDSLCAGIHEHLRYWTLQELLHSVSLVKKRINVITYSDMIGKLRDALQGPNRDAIVAGMRARYKAAFIDEFQDTDRRQYEIFEAAFGAETILFLIGDPKQSIYGWRSADVFTYFEARRGVDRVYSMNTNFRSSAALIDGMNYFFLPKPGFSTFAFPEGEDSFSYIPVTSPATNKKEGLFRNGTRQQSIALIEENNVNDVREAAAMQIAALLQNGYQLKENGVLRDVRPSDIGVLVRTKNRGLEIKDRLARWGVAAVYVDEMRILQTPQAGELVHLLQAILEPSRGAINRALLCTLLPFTNEDLQRLNDEKVLRHFATYRTTWQQDGILPALTRFIHDFEIRAFLLNQKDGYRIFSNFLQLAELVHTTQTRRKLTETELLGWLQRALREDGMTSGDEFLQRMERDDEAVEIITIHKSKGLEYNLMIAPDLNWDAALEAAWIPTVSYRDPETGRYFFVEKTRLNDRQRGLYKEQENQENRRLMYVAVTRAVHAAFLFTTTNQSRMGTTMWDYTDALRKGSHPEFIWGQKEAPEHRTPNITAEDSRYEVLPELEQFKPDQAWWRRLSFSGLAAKGPLMRLERPQAVTDPYDQFVFDTLRRGSKTGDLLHYLLERAMPDQPTSWNWAIGQTLNRYAPARKAAYTPLLQQLLQHLAGAQIRMPDGTMFTLGQVSFERRIPEFEFDFPVSLFRMQGLRQAIESAGLVVGLRDQFTEAQGLMNGKMDLFFEYEGRYYILDWKSVYLGDVPEAYDDGALSEAMDRSNYHLQYLLYTLAAQKYLKQRLPGFSYERDFGGVIYLFVRGVRSGQETGIYTAKPPASLITELDRLFGEPQPIRR